MVTAFLADPAYGEHKTRRPRVGAQVASLVAAVSFVMFPLALPGGLLAAILGGIAVSRGRTRGATSHGQAIAGIVCGVLALVVAVVFAVRFGTFVANNTSVFTTFDNCIAKASDRSAVADCRRPIRERRPALGSSGPDRTLAIALKLTKRAWTRHWHGRA